MANKHVIQLPQLNTLKTNQIQSFLIFLIFQLHLIDDGNMQIVLNIFLI